MLGSVQRLGLGSGMLVAVPIPPDQAVEGEEVESAIRTALQEVDKRGIKGNEVGGPQPCVHDCVYGGDMRNRGTDVDADAAELGGYELRQ